MENIGGAAGGRGEVDNKKRSTVKKKVVGGNETVRNEGSPVQGLFSNLTPKNPEYNDKKMKKGSTKKSFMEKSSKDAPLAVSFAKDPPTSSTKLPQAIPQQNRTTTPSLYPTLEAVTGNSVRTIYPPLFDDDDNENIDDLAKKMETNTTDGKVQLTSPQTGKDDVSPIAPGNRSAGRAFSYGRRSNRKASLEDDVSPLPTSALVNNNTPKHHYQQSSPQMNTLPKQEAEILTTASTTKTPKRLLEPQHSSDFGGGKSDTHKRTDSPINFNSNHNNVETRKQAPLLKHTYDGSDDDHSSDSELRRALLESSQLAEATAAASLSTNKTTTPRSNFSHRSSSSSKNANNEEKNSEQYTDIDNRETKLSLEQRETIESNARTLTSVLQQQPNNAVDPEVIQFCIDQCEQDLTTLSQIIPLAGINGNDHDDDNLLNDLLQLHEKVLTVLEFAKEHMQQNHEDQFYHTSDSTNTATSTTDTFQTRVQSPDTFTGPPAAHNGTLSQHDSALQIDALVEKQDIFSLICMLRSQDNCQRLGAAMALMKFASQEDNARVRNEIHSSGGLHSLLTLFSRSKTSLDARLVSGLAAAYVFPATAQQQGPAVKPQVGLRMLECIQYLLSSVTDESTTVMGHVITQLECWRVAATGLTTFWIHSLEPMIRNYNVATSTTSTSNGGRNNNTNYQETVPDYLPPTTLEARSSSTASFSTRLHRNRSGMTQTNQSLRVQQAGIQELLEIAVLLVIRLATSIGNAKKGLDMNRYTADIVLLVEQVCAMEAACPIAVREGIFRILVDWIRNGDSVSMRPTAILSLRHLTTIKDRYMAGWIHSQMVSSGALPAIVALTKSTQTCHQDSVLSVYPVRLAICQVFASLCMAPHTRASVMEADCVHFLIDLLYDEYNPKDDGANQELVLFALQALWQLAAGAMQRAGDLWDDKDLVQFTSRERHDQILSDIVNRGAIASLVAIASAKRENLRMIAIETLRVLSEDVSPSRGTRLQLCEDGAARALGETLMDCLSRTDKYGLDLSDVDLEQLYRALCALSNILDPTYEGTIDSHRDSSVGDASGLLRTKSLLNASCRQTIESGGLQSMLQLSSFPLVEVRLAHLVGESCHSLSLLSRFLVSKDIASKGLAGWADQVLDVFCYVVNMLGHESSDDYFGKNMDLHVSVLQGIGALAKSAPLKIRIVDRVLPYVIRAKNSRHYPYVSNSASQAFQFLEFADDEVAVQTAGNNANLLADWFCLQRSLLIQAMARVEIRQLLVETWGEAFAQAKDPAPTLTKFARTFSGGSRSSAGSSMGYSTELLAHIGVDGESSEKDVQSIIREYQDMFGPESVCKVPFTWKSNHPEIGADSSESQGLLSQQVFPLNSSQTETLWILNHAQLVADCFQTSSKGLSDHVEKLLEQCFPSRLLRDQVIANPMINLESSYNFRAILMAQRRYFSFRREGLLLLSLCDKESAASDITDMHWTLNFTNSSFAGEFPESLVQALYLCPTICALSFVRCSRTAAGVKQPPQAEKSTGNHSAGADGGGALLANLVGSLPPWVAYLTFERVLDDQDVRALVANLETIGRLTAGHGVSQTIAATTVSPGVHTSEALDVQTRGKFSFFAIRDSPTVSAATWRSFFDLIGHVNIPSPTKSKANPLSTLRYLDVSWNGLGDELCARLLGIIYNKGSGCHIEELDLTGNRIAEGTHVLRVFADYAQTHRSHKLSGVQVRGKHWQAPLRNLRLASNFLSQGKAWLEIIALLKYNTIELRTLDLSSNELALKEDDYDSDILVSSMLKNAGLQHIDLSGNKFSSGTIDDMLGRLKNISDDAVVPLIDLTNNFPALSEKQQRQLEEIGRSSRNVLLQRFNSENEARKTKGDLVEEASSEVESIDVIKEDRSSLSVQQEPSSDTNFPAAEPLADNKITVLFSAPLVFKDGTETLRPFAKLDFDMERELLWQCLKEASRDIELTFDTATHDRLLATISKRCSCLHYSGHGNEHYLPFEDGKGGPNWFEVEDIKKLIGEREGDVPFRFVFVSACYSGLAGETFAAAGVPHVVCCRQEFELKDAAALAFTRQFYLALAVGHTVKVAFELGCKAVRATPNLRDAEKEMEKFVLLPRTGNHNIPIFDAKPIPHWPGSLHGSSGMTLRASTRQKSIRSLGKAGSSELIVRNMIQEDPCPSPSQFFLGREVDMYIVLNLLLVKRLVSVIGDVGLGRSSLVCALCHYINERKSTMNQVNHIFYVKAKQGRAKQNRVKSLVQRLVKKLIEADLVMAEDVDKNADIETLFDIICKHLKNEKSLIVFDRTELLEDSDEANEFPMLLSNLFRETRNVRVLLTAKATLGIPSIGGHVEHYFRLGPLTYANSVRLFSSLCPYLHTPSDRRRLYSRMVATVEEAELFPTDPGISPAVRNKFAMIGNGIPSNIEKAAYTISKEDYMSLLRAGAGQNSVESIGD